MPSMPGSGTAVPPVDPPEVVVPPEVVAPPEVLLVLVEVEVEVEVEVLCPQPGKCMCVPPEEPPHHEKVADAGEAEKTAMPNARAMADFVIMLKPPRRRWLSKLLPLVQQ